ncbi:hypothetical protein SEA_VALENTINIPUFF_13 [Microbacterium phage ValentiniPuff]|uniref:Uncharacterized protein n=1 Tax=Microbacterium phage ValentiniPuff TaxID=2315705 RepID=A0A386KSL2_9CAUD|nr:hypothetical protein SEA_VALENTINIPUFF_13 [Microbacterium phage ValentiniPuff]
MSNFHAAVDVIQEHSDWTVTEYKRLQGPDISPYPFPLDLSVTFEVNVLDRIIHAHFHNGTADGGTFIVTMPVNDTIRAYEPCWIEEEQEITFENEFEAYTFYHAA